jgi:hypothetical protein
MLVIAGVQVISLGLAAHAYGAYFMGEKDAWFDRMRARFRLEHGLMAGGLLLALGLIMCVVIFIAWAHRGFADLGSGATAVVATVLVILGLQVIFSSFLLSILGLRRTDR